MQRLANVQQKENGKRMRQKRKKCKEAKRRKNVKCVRAWGHRNPGTWTYLRRSKVKWPVIFYGQRAEKSSVLSKLYCANHMGKKATYKSNVKHTRGNISCFPWKQGVNINLAQKISFTWLCFNNVVYPAYNHFTTRFVDYGFNGKELISTWLLCKQLSRVPYGPILHEHLCSRTGVGNVRPGGFIVFSGVSLGVKCSLLAILMLHGHLRRGLNCLNGGLKIIPGLNVGLWRGA